jgi:hypothetical protein
MEQDHAIVQMVGYRLLTTGTGFIHLSSSSPGAGKTLIIVSVLKDSVSPHTQ